MPRLLDRYALFYPMRIAGSYFLILLVFLHLRAPRGFGPFHWLLVAVLLLHPHFFHYLTRRLDHHRKQTEHQAFLVDSFLLGLVVYVTGYSPLPSLILATVALANAVAVNGLRQLVLSALALAAGAAVPWLITRKVAPGEATAGVELACSVFLFVYFLFFAYSSHNRNLLLIRSQEELREQKSILEIEKARSDQLVLSLVPAPLSEEFTREGRLDPIRLQSVTLLAVEFPDLSDRLMDREPAEVLAYLSRSIRACDAIAVRHGLEPVKTTGQLYLAMTGLRPAGDPDPATVVRAAREIRDFLADQTTSRHAHDLFDIDSGIAVHSGIVHCGLVATERVTFDLWGDAVEEVLGMAALAGAGQVLISESVGALAENGPAFSPAGTLPTRSGGEIALLAVETEEA